MTLLTRLLCCAAALLLVTSPTQLQAKNLAMRAVYKCASVNQPIRYQDTPCLAHEQSHVLQVADTDPAYKPPPASAQTNQTRSKRHTSTQRQQQSAQALQAQQAKTPKRTGRKRTPRGLQAQMPAQNCPPTREEPGIYAYKGSSWQAPGGQRGKSKTPLAAMWLHYKLLPSKTYLKNQGQWPKHCPP